MCTAILGNDVKREIHDVIENINRILETIYGGREL